MLLNLVSMGLIRQSFVLRISLSPTLSLVTIAYLPVPSAIVSDTFALPSLGESHKAFICCSPQSINSWGGCRDWHAGRKDASAGWMTICCNCLSGFEFLGALCTQWNSCGHFAAVSSDRCTLRRGGVLKEKVSGCIRCPPGRTFSPLPF